MGKRKAQNSKELYGMSFILHIYLIQGPRVYSSLCVHQKQRCRYSEDTSSYLTVHDKHMVTKPSVYQFVIFHVDHTQRSSVCPLLHQAWPSRSDIILMGCVSLNLFFYPVFAWSFAIIASVFITKSSLRRFELQAQQDNMLFCGYWLYSYMYLHYSQIYIL